MYLVCVYSNFCKDYPQRNDVLFFIFFIFYIEKVIILNSQEAYMKTISEVKVKI